MTKSQRAQVVELLRCAADYDDWSCGVIGLVRGSKFFDIHGANARLAWHVSGIVLHERLAAGLVDQGFAGRRHDLLEAALRVEQGWSP